MELAGFIGPTRRTNLRRQPRAVLGGGERGAEAYCTYAEHQSDPTTTECEADHAAPDESGNSSLTLSPTATFFILKLTALTP
ncbi:MAG TPA: hypothetical protein VHR47_13915 [Bacillota bacterium]|nr:hypothetical protein [Bacillota bacterium]